MTSEADDEMLLGFLRAQRHTVLAIVEGLSEADWHRPVVPTGWTPAGMIEHLGGAEWHWFQGVVGGKEPELPGDLDEDQAPYDPATVTFAAEGSPKKLSASTVTSARRRRPCWPSLRYRSARWAGTAGSNRRTSAGSCST